MQNRGFSLIELILVVILLGILAALAYPSYLNYLTRMRRYDGRAALLDLANRMERYYSEQNTYQTATVGTGKITDIKSSNLSFEQWYKLAITSQTTTTYSLQATPRMAQAVSDKDCQTLTLNNFGDKGISIGPNGTPIADPTRCW